MQHALNINNDSIKETMPSLYLNIGKCYEDLNHLYHAKASYQQAFSFTAYLPGNGYGNMIKAGITNGLKRIGQGDKQYPGVDPVSDSR